MLMTREHRPVSIKKFINSGETFVTTILFVNSAPAVQIGLCWRVSVCWIPACALLRSVTLQLQNGLPAGIAFGKLILGMKVSAIDIVSQSTGQQSINFIIYSKKPQKKMNVARYSVQWRKF